ncbi:hypothetical protein QE370_000372 [Aeromicrobium sp. SORGH_AS981]|nr:hypothetical protein [Aeromicrobium sp. SORGH_AS_0981]
MPMPALNIMAIQETVRNSGFSSSSPSGTRPYLEAASHSTKRTKNDATSTKNQPVLTITQEREASEAALRPSVLTRPQTTKAMATTPVTPKTTGSILRRHPASGACSCSVRVLMRHHLFHR